MATYDEWAARYRAKFAPYEVPSEERERVITEGEVGQYPGDSPEPYLKSGRKEFDRLKADRLALTEQVGKARAKEKELHPHPKLERFFDRTIGRVPSFLSPDVPTPETAFQPVAKAAPSPQKPLPRFSDSRQEAKFQDWYKQNFASRGINPNPDDPLHYYDYRKAFQEDMQLTPDPSDLDERGRPRLHGDSKYKLPGHPREYLETPQGRLHTPTGQVTPGSRFQVEDGEIIDTKHREIISQDQFNARATPQERAALNGQLGGAAVDVPDDGFVLEVPEVHVVGERITQAPAAAPSQKPLIFTDKQGNVTRTTQPQAPKTTIESDIKELGRQVAAGAVVDLPKMGGQALQAFSPKDSIVSKFGKELAADAKLREAGWAPDLDGRGDIAGAFIRGGRAIAPSLSTMAAYLNPYGAVAGPMATVALFGGSQYTETYDKVKEAGGSDDDARNAGLIAGAIQGGGEVASNWLALRMFGAGKTLATQQMQRLLGETTSPSVIRPWLKSTASAFVGEPATEIAQDVGTAFTERSYGVKTAPLDLIAKESGSAALGMTALLSPFGLHGHYRQAQRASAIDHLLTDPNAASPEERAQVVQMLHDEGVSSNIPDADRWLAGALQDVSEGRPVRRTAAAPQVMTPDEAIATPAPKKPVAVESPFAGEAEKPPLTPEEQVDRRQRFYELVRRQVAPVGALPPELAIQHPAAPFLVKRKQAMQPITPEAVTPEPAPVTNELAPEQPLPSAPELESLPATTAPSQRDLAPEPEADPLPDMNLAPMTPADVMASPEPVKPPPSVPGDPLTDDMREALDAPLEEIPVDRALIDTGPALETIDRMYRQILDDTKATHHMKREQKDAWQVVKRVDQVMKAGLADGLEYEQAVQRVDPADLQALEQIMGKKPEAVPTPALASTQVEKAEVPTPDDITNPMVQQPRSELPLADNMEMQLRAEKAQADLEIAGKETGRRKVFDYDVSGQGGTPEVTGLQSASPGWYTELTTGPRPLKRQQIDTAIQKIIKDHGVDVGVAVERVKAAILQDREFNKTPWGEDADAIARGEWPSWMEKPAKNAQPLTPDRATLPSMATDRGPGSSDQAQQPPEPGRIKTNSKEFKKWFGESVVTDNNGKPLAVYHGSHSGLRDGSWTSTDFTKIGVATFTSDHEIASKYSRGMRPVGEDNQFVPPPDGEMNGSIISVFLKIEKPITEDTTLEDVLGTEEEADEYRSYNLDPFGLTSSLDGLGDIEYIAEIAEKSETFRKYLRTKGYDGFIFPDQESGGTTYIPFGKEQIKQLPNPSSPQQGGPESVPTPDFALSSPTVKRAKPKAEDKRTSIPVPTEVIGSRPIIGRETTPEESPLFSKAAQEKEAEQTTLIDAAPSVTKQEPKVSTPDTVTMKETAPKAKRKLTVKQMEEKRRAYFTPGNIVSAYGGTQDVVIAYRLGATAYDWSVDVKEVLPSGKLGPVRTHATQPSMKEMEQFEANPKKMALESLPTPDQVSTNQARVPTPEVVQGKATPTETALDPNPESPKQKPSKYALDTIDKMYRTILDDTKAVHHMRRDNKDAWATVKRIDTAMKESQKSGMDYDEAAGKISMDDIDKLSDILSTQEKSSVKDEKIEALGAPDRKAKTQPWTADKGGRLYHGTGASITFFRNDRPVYLTDNPDEAKGYAHQLHLNGTKGTPKVYEVHAEPGAALDINPLIDAAIENDGEIETAIKEGTKKAKVGSYRYMTYTHPPFSGDEDQNVVVSLYPKDDLTIEETQEGKITELGKPDDSQKTAPGQDESSSDHRVHAMQAKQYNSFATWKDGKSRTPGSLIEHDARMANASFFKDDKQNFEIQIANTSQLSPTQSGEDYINDSSKELARKTRATIDGREEISRLEDYIPILVNKDGSVLDGNHRHAAASMNGESLILVMVPTGKGDGTVTNLREFYRSIKGGDAPIPKFRRGDQSPIAAKSTEAPSPAKELADLFKQETEQAKKKVVPTKPRIPVAPITGGESVPVGDIILNLEKGVGRKLTVGKTKRGTAGTYKPGSTATLIKYSGDLDTTAHELSHALDDQYGLVKEWKGQDTSPFDAELMPFAQHGSQKAITSRTYDRAEGVAEYLRAWVVNPDAAEAGAPQFTAHMKKVLPADIQKALKTFSTQVRQWAGNSAHAKIMANVQWETPETGLTQWLTGTRTAKGPGFHLTFGDQLATVWTDRLAPFMKAIKYASDQRGIDKPLPGDDPALLSRLFMGVNAKIDDIFAHGMVDSRLDRATPGGLTWLMDPLDRTSVKAMDAEMQQVASLMIAQRTIEKAEQLGKERVSGIGAGIEEDRAVAEARLSELKKDETRYARLTEAASRYRQWADANLRYLVEKGRLSQEQYESIKANNEQYVAMQRIIEVSPDEELATFLPSGGSKKIGSVGQPVKTFEGSTRTIKNPYLSLMDATHKAIREADRNEIMKLFRDLLTTDRGMYEGEPKDLATIGREAKAGEKQTIPIFVNGAKEVWQFHPDIYKALKGIEEGEYKLPPVLTVLPRILRATIVNAPPFALRNIIRDSWHRAILSLSGSKPWDTLKVYSKDEIAQLKKSGGDQAGHYYTDAKNYARAMRYAMEEAVHSTNSVVVDPSKLMGWIRKGGQGYLDLMQGSERQGRLSEYRRAFTKAQEKFGYDDYHAMLYAAGQSRNLIDYAVAGNWMLLLNQMIPFSNAAVQGLRSSALRAKANPDGFALRYGAFAIVPSLITYAWNALYGDGDDLDEYRQLPAYQRDLFWNFKLGPDLWLKVPKPFELGVTATTMERLMDYILGNEKAFDGHVGSMVRTLLPVDEASFAGPYQAIFQAAANYDFFRDRPIVPRWEENLELDLRSYNRASRLGQALQQAIGVDARKIDFVIQQQFGYLGRYAADVSDVGRKDRHGLTVTSTGMVSTSPASVSLDARKVADIAEERGVVPSHGKTVERIGHVKEVGDRASKHPDSLRYGVFRKHLNQYYKAESGEDRDKLAKLVREEATLLRARWEKTPPREEATENAGKKRAERTHDPLMEMLGLDYAPISKHPVTALHELVP